MLAGKVVTADGLQLGGSAMCSVEMTSAIILGVLQRFNGDGAISHALDEAEGDYGGRKTPSVGYMSR